MYSPYPHMVQGGAGQPGNHASLPAYNPNLNTAPSHHQPQPPQHMMYNPHQYAHQSPYGAGNPIMTGMQMHNGGTAHNGGNSNGVPHYQTPYTSSPYGSGIPTSTAGPGHPHSYNQAFGMGMPPQQQQQHQQQQQQQQQQRMMQPPPPSSTPNSHSGGPSRASPYPPPALPHQMTPPNASSAQFAPHPSQAHPQNLPGQQQQQQQQSLHQSHQIGSQNAGANQNHGGQNQQQTTPSTPTFLPPLSPGSEGREKERVSVLLEINRDLLFEVLRTQALQTEIKKEAEADANPPDAKFTERKNQVQQDYQECMRRIQYNLAYLAAIADRAHKPTAKIPNHPAFMFAPPLSQTTTSFNFSSPMMTNATPPKSENPHSPNNPPPAVKVEADVHIEKESRINALKDNYKKLQDLFNTTEIDVKKEMEIKLRMQAQQQHQQSQQMYSQNQQQQSSPLSGGGQQRLPSQQLAPNLLQNNMGSQMQGQVQGPQQQPMNLAMNSAMGMASMNQNPGMGPLNMPSQVDMGFQRGLPGMQR